MEIDSIVNSLKTMSQVSNYKIYGFYTIEYW